MRRSTDEGAALAFVHELRVRYVEVDAQRVVFHAHWLSFFDDAVTRYFDHLGYDPTDTWMTDAGFDVMLRRSVVEWSGSARFDDLVRVAVVPTRLGTSSFDLTYRASVDDREVVTATTTYVVVVPGTAQSQPIPDDLRARLEADLEPAAAVR